MPMKIFKKKNRKTGNGLSIHTSYTGLEESLYRRSFIDYFFLSVILCLGILGLLFTVASCFSIPIYVPLTVYVLALAALYGCLTFYFNSAWRLWLPAGVLLYLLFFWLFEESVQEGLFWIAGSILTQVNEYLGSSYTLPPLYNEIQSSSGTAGLLAVCLPLCPLLSWCLIRAKRSYAYVLTLGFGFLWPFCLGTSADTASGILVFLSVLLSVAVRSGGKKRDRTTETHIQKKTGPVVLLMIVLSLSIGLAFLAPLIEKSLGNRLELKRTINGYLTAIDPFRPGSSYTERGVGSGSLAQISSLAGPVTNHLRLTLTDEPPVINIYLEGYIGAEYTNLGWDPADSDTFQEYFSTVRAANPGAFIRNLSYPPYYMNMEAVSQLYRYQSMDVELINADPSYYYTPYTSFYEDNMVLCADSYIYGNQESSYSVFYNPLFIVNDIPPGAKAEGTADSNIKTRYNDYVNKTYLQVPDHVRERFQDDIAHTASSDPFTAIRNVLSLLMEQTTYDTSPGRVPVGRDFAEYFFYRNRKGFCVHYATTAVLMLRMNGIPARFVSGYRVSPSEFHEKDNGTYQAIVTSEDAHAWVEVYIDHVGWLVAEATPGFERVDFGDGSQAPEAPENPGTNEAETTPTPTPSVTPAPSAASDADASQDGAYGGSDLADRTSHLWKVVFPYIGWIILGALLLPAIGLGILKSLRAYARFGNLKSNINDRIRKTYLSISRLLTLDGLKEKPEYPNEEWVLLLSGKYPDLPAGIFEEILEDTRKACYGEKQLPEFSLEFMIQKYGMLRGSVYSKRSWFGRLWLWIRE